MVVVRNASKVPRFPDTEWLMTQGRYQNVVGPNPDSGQ